MTGNETEEFNHAVDRFWHNYLFILENIPPWKDRDSGITRILKHTLPHI